MRFVESTQRRHIRDDMRHMRGTYTDAYFLYPTETECTATDCGHDELTDSGYNVSCSTCNGVGYTLSWATWVVHARVKQIDLVQLMRSGPIPPGLEIGDAEIYLSERAKEMVERIEEESRAYVYIEGQRYRPTNLSYDGVGRADEWRVELKRVHPEVRPTGY